MSDGPQSLTQFAVPLFLRNKRQLREFPEPRIEESTQ